MATILIREEDYLLHKKELTEVSQAAMNAVSAPAVASFKAVQLVCAQCC